MGSKGLFPGVAVPLAFFCTLFFRHRKKSVSAPWDGKSQSAPESARQAPLGGNPLRPSYLLSCKQGGFPRGKQSARFALPCAPLVVCLNNRALTAFGGCIHWIPASLRSPLHPLRRVGVSPGRRDCVCGRTGAFLGANNRHFNPIPQKHRGRHSPATPALFYPFAAFPFFFCSHSTTATIINTVTR